MSDKTPPLAAPARHRPAKDGKKPARTPRPPKKPRGTRPKKTAQPAHAPWYVLIFKGVVVTSLWVAIILSLVIAWYAVELPRITQDPGIERKSVTEFYTEDGKLLARYGDLTGVSVSVADLQPHVVQPFLAIEDRRFYSHFGIDPIGLARAMMTNVTKGGIVQGGSTITQQLAKNLFLSHERTYKRKIQEVLLALWLEQRLTKDEILSAYLNLVYFGGGAYGIDAAAKLYFDKPAAKLTVNEAAMLAGMLKAPSRYSPIRNPSLAQERANVVLGAMADAGYIKPDQLDRLRHLTPESLTNEGLPSQTVKYFTDWVLKDIQDTLTYVHEDMKVKTTLDPALQAKAEETVAAYVKQAEADGKNVSQGAMVVMRRDGAILAMVGGKNYAASQFNRATQALRSPGSSFKTFVYIAALEKGWKPNDMISDEPLRVGKYKPENYKNEYLGEISLLEALTFSQNTAAVRLMQAVGTSSTIDVAKRMGIDSPLQPDLSLALGSSGVTLLEMVNAYAVLANGGQRVTPFAIHSVTDDQGNVFFMPARLSPDNAALSPAVVQNIDMMLRSVVTYGTGQNAAIGMPVAGKTGTSQDHRDAWFVGYSGDLVAGVWVGNDNNTPMKAVTGGSLPAKIWHDVMQSALERGLIRPTLYEQQDNLSGLRPRNEGEYEPAPLPQQEAAPQEEPGMFGRLLHELTGRYQD